MADIPFLCSIRGYEAPVAKDARTGRRRLQALQRASLGSIGAVLFEKHRHGTHLVFVGSKRDAEMLCADLKARSAAASLNDRFDVHHGSMGKKERERLEQSLRNGEPRTVVTTATLDLGMDIGTVDSVELIGAPRSLSAMRQRIGRSGRRLEPSMATIHVTEEPVGAAVSLLDRLRLNTVRAVASLNLLGKRFVEPPTVDGTMLSVVLQQTLSYVRQNDAVTFRELSRLIQSVAPFERLSRQSYRELVAELCAPGVGLLREEAESGYRLSERGEKLFDSREIFAVFQTAVDWDVWTRSEWIGCLLRSMPVEVGDEFRLGGKAWKAIAVSAPRNRITVEPSVSGATPYFDISAENEIDPVLAGEMRRVLADEVAIPAYRDPISRRFLSEGRAAFQEAGLHDRTIVEQPDQQICHLFTWKGTRFNSLLAAMLRYKRFPCEPNEIAVTVSCRDVAHICDALHEDLPTIEELSRFIECLNLGKFDKWIPEHLLREDWVKRHAEFGPELSKFCRSVEC
jgi:ATP-dependent Lhr-like helicase